MSLLFRTDRYAAIQNRIKKFLNDQDSFLSGSTAGSTRAVGDAIQEILSSNFPSIVGDDLCVNYSEQFARKAMEDMAFEDADGCYYAVDVKTHRLGTNFNMPNLISVKRLAQFYENEKNYFTILMVTYRIHNLQAVVEHVTFAPIEFIDWKCLTIGALGWGQIQIADSNRISISRHHSRKEWMLKLCDAMFEFYPKEIKKIDRRMELFRKIRDAWSRRRD